MHQIYCLGDKSGTSLSETSSTAHYPGGCLGWLPGKAAMGPEVFPRFCGHDSLPLVQKSSFLVSLIVTLRMDTYKIPILFFRVSYHIHFIVSMKTDFLLSTFS